MAPDKTVPRVPDGSRVYAIGDSHGRLDLLEMLQDMILAYSEMSAPAREVVVYLGDYVDRGPDSKGLIERLIEKPLPGFESVHLMGNHEDFMLGFLARPEMGPNWFYNGGDTTLESYGVRRPGEWASTEAYADAQAQLTAALPRAHLQFLQALRLSHTEGDYLFVHAGIRPEIPIAEQSPEDLMWIRDEFLNSDTDFGKVVVHGHTPEREVQFRHNRIGIDSGAVFTGRLTCLVLEGEERRLLQTG